jgi:hypothetical protein
MTARVVSDHSENCRGCFVVSIVASPWSRRRWFLKRPTPTASHGLLLLNIYMAGLARDLVLGPASPGGGAGRGPRLPLNVACQVLGGIWEEVSAGLVAAYSRLQPSQANLHQYRIDVNYACQLLGVWAQGVSVGPCTVALNKHQQAMLRNAACALCSWCVLKAAPLHRVLSLLQHVETQARTVSEAGLLSAPQDPDRMVLATPSVSPAASPSALRGAHPQRPQADDAARSTQHMHVLVMLNRVGSEQGPQASFSDEGPAASEVDLRMLDVSLPEVASMVAATLRKRPEFEKAPFPPLEESEVTAAVQLRAWLDERCPG